MNKTASEIADAVLIKEGRRRIITSIRDLSGGGRDFLQALRRQTRGITPQGTAIGNALNVRDGMLLPEGTPLGNLVNSSRLSKQLDEIVFRLQKGLS